MNKVYIVKLVDEETFYSEAILKIFAKKLDAIAYVEYMKVINRYDGPFIIEEYSLRRTFPVERAIHLWTMMETCWRRNS